MSWLDRFRSPLLFSLIGLLIGGAGVLALRWPRPAGVQLTLPPTPAASPTAEAPPPIRVYVCGAVEHPDVYRLPPGSIVEDALEAAGGATDQADLVRINLAQALVDQSQVYVPAFQDTARLAPVSTPAPTAGGAAVWAGGLVDVNSASLEELDGLPGIGPTLGQRIIDHRPYGAIEELLRVPGIGPATFEKLRDKVVVR